MILILHSMHILYIIVFFSLISNVSTSICILFAKFIFAGSVVSPLSYVSKGIIDTVAGNGNSGYSGDGGQAVDAELGRAKGVSVDQAGKLYIADESNNVIRMVDDRGIISIVVGSISSDINGDPNIGDGGQATNAILNGPSDIHFDRAGRMFIADRGNDLIRMVDKSGIITTVAGKYNRPPSICCDGVQATNAKLGDPQHIHVDQYGKIFISERGGLRIRMVDVDGFISTVAGSGSYGDSGEGGLATNANLYFPMGISVDQAGNLFIADSYNNKIKMVDTSGIITTVAGDASSRNQGSGGYSGDGGQATNAKLSLPYEVHIDQAGRMFIAEFGNDIIRMVDTSGVITTVAGNVNPGYRKNYGDGGQATNAGLRNPFDVHVDEYGSIFIADSSNNRIRKVQGTCLFLFCNTTAMTMDTL